MDKKTGASIVLEKISYVLAALILAVWSVMYLYFLSSSQTPSSIYNYNDEMNLKEKALERTLINTRILNADPADLIKVYELSACNKLCRGKVADAEEEMQAALGIAKDKYAGNKEFMARIYLKEGNLSRDFNNFDLAKLNYTHSLNYLQQIPLNPDFKNSLFVTAVVNFNNLGILYFLIGQKTINEENRQKYYRTARDYFARAKYLLYFSGIKESKCLPHNIDQNLNRCLLELQSFH